MSFSRGILLHRVSNLVSLFNHNQIYEHLYLKVDFLMISLLLQ